MLSKYRTFGFYADDSSLENSKAYEQQIAFAQKEIAAQLQSRGLTQQNSSPDLLVNIGLVVDERTQTRETNFQTDRPKYTGQRRYTWQSKEVEVGTYKAGTLSVHLVDPTQNQLLWKGEAETVMPKKAQDIQERISKSIQALFKKIR
ncbi:DUF4136 domain-containing protein [Nibribacter ruber]|uniref:DUF4136 domain-containing protein n=1 Tax=Nibribacter ruber TaxID=2698458 RepID=UPI001E5A9B3B|nr:DUF4136 domain-containing protein [Nibribacter ruber]